MPPMVYAILSALGALFRSQRSLRGENIALRHQLAIYQRTVEAPAHSTRGPDRFVAAITPLSPWREQLVFAQPATVIACQRKLA